MSVTYSTDFLVIGGGSAGYAAARTAAEHGLDVMIVEGGAEVGGLCILRGCMPSKTLIESANRFATLRRASEFGLRAESVRVVPQEIQERKRRLIKEFADYRSTQLEDGRFTFVRGRASFLNSDTVCVHRLDGSVDHVHYKSALIASGSFVHRLDLPGLAAIGTLTSDEVLDSDHMPESIVVLGGGPVALEMAHYYNALGAKVTIIQRSPQVLKGTDPDVAQALMDALRHAGITLYTDTILQKADMVDGRKRIHFTHCGTQKFVEAEEVLEAMGRRPHSDTVNPSAAGVLTKSNGAVTIDRTMQTSVEGIYAAGDVCGPFEIVHVAIQQGEIAARNAARRLGHLSGTAEQIEYHPLLFVVFTEPQLAVAGWTEQEALDNKVGVITASYPFADHGKSIVMGETEGFVKLLAHADTGVLMGAAVVGPHASDLIHEAALAIKMQVTARQFAASPHYHPTLSEIWTYPAEELAEKIKN